LAVFSGCASDGVSVGIEFDGTYEEVLLAHALLHGWHDQQQELISTELLAVAQMGHSHTIAWRRRHSFCCVLSISCNSGFIPIYFCYFGSFLVKSTRKVLARAGLSLEKKRAYASVGVAWQA